MKDRFQLLNAFLYCRGYSVAINHFARYIQDKQVQLLICGDCLVHLLFVQPPGLYHQPAQPVALYRFAELLFGHREPRPYGRDFGPARHQVVHKPYL